MAQPFAEARVCAGKILELSRLYRPMPGSVDDRLLEIRAMFVQGLSAVDREIELRLSEGKQTVRGKPKQETKFPIPEMLDLDDLHLNLYDYWCCQVVVEKPGLTFECWLVDYVRHIVMREWTEDEIPAKQTE